MRVIFSKGGQKVWLSEITDKLGIDFVAKVCRVSPRTIRDWRREKYTISKRALLTLSKRARCEIPLGIRWVPDFWYVSKGARKGALRRLELYGPPGNLESRKKGGMISQQRRRENPEKYRVAGCNVRKIYKMDKPTIDFAELTGIILGDGSISDTQLRITVNSITDRLYAKFISRLILKIFGEKPSVIERKDKHTLDVTISGVGLVELLLGRGFVKGNKILQQVDFPVWIWNNKEFQTACVRGLMDTDGGLYFHEHWTGRIKYRNLGLCFTSYSKRLLKSVCRVLTKFGIKHSIVKERRLYIYDLEQIKRYFQIFDTNNPKHKKKLTYHLKHNRVIAKI